MVQLTWECFKSVQLHISYGHPRQLGTFIQVTLTYFLIQQLLCSPVGLWRQCWFLAMEGTTPSTYPVYLILEFKAFICTQFSNLTKKLKKDKFKILCILLFVSVYNHVQLFIKYIPFATMIQLSHSHIIVYILIHHSVLSHTLYNILLILIHHCVFIQEFQV